MSNENTATRKQADVLCPERLVAAGGNDADTEAEKSKTRALLVEAVDLCKGR